MTLTLLHPTASRTSPEDHCPVWEIFATSDLNHTSALGYITRFGDLFEVLEVVAPYDLAYTKSLPAATAHFEALAHEAVVCVDFM